MMEPIFHLELTSEATTLDENLSTNCQEHREHNLVENQ